MVTVMVAVVSVVVMVVVMVAVPPVHNSAGRFVWDQGGYSATGQSQSLLAIPRVTDA